MANRPAYEIRLEIAPTNERSKNAKNSLPPVNEVKRLTIPSLDIANPQINTASLAVGSWWACRLLAHQTGDLTPADVLSRVGPQKNEGKIKMFGQRLAEIIDRDRLATVGAELEPDDALKEATLYADLGSQIYFDLLGPRTSICEGQVPGQQVVVAQHRPNANAYQVWPPVDIAEVQK